VKLITVVSATSSGLQHRRCSVFLSRLRLHKDSPKRKGANGMQCCARRCAKDTAGMGGGVFIAKLQPLRPRATESGRSSV